jgi:hypothetical protein
MIDIRHRAAVDKLADSTFLDQRSEVHIGFGPRKVIERYDERLGSGGCPGLSGHGMTPFMNVERCARFCGIVGDIVAGFKENKQPQEGESLVTISSYLEDDHRRIEGYLQNAERYPEFRGALARHIGMEEKILFPAIRNTSAGKSIPGMEQLHLDHGALVALLVPTPTAAIVEAIRSILERHNLLEEGPNGIYRQYEKLATPDEIARILAKLQSAPPVPMNPNVDSAIVRDSMHAALARAGYSFKLWEGRHD